MSITLGEPEPRPAPPRRGHTLLAWLVIAGVIGFQVWWNARRTVKEEKGDDLTLMQAQARTFVGLANLPGASTEDLYKQARTLDRGPYTQRLRFAVLAGELAGPAEARKRLAALRAQQTRGEITPTPEEAGLASLLDRLYAGYERSLKRTARDKTPRPGAPDLSPDKQEKLREQLGWFGELALAPAGSPDEALRAEVLAAARRTVWGEFGVLGGMLCGAFLGLVLLILAGAFWLAGKLRGGLTPAERGGVYAETFAWYMVLFPALSLGVAWGMRAVLSPALREQVGLLASALPPLGSLLALAWPVLRGVSWRQVRQDIGWTWGRRPGLEPLVGLGCYLGALFMLLAGLLVYFGLTVLVKRLGIAPPTPSHPIVQEVAQSGWRGWLEVLFLASVVAPFVEETMFRGVLYRHLRDATASWAGRVGSVLGSAVLSSVVFAAIHPQGLLFVPVLGGLAFVFALTREWRGTLVPTMIAHGINNTVVLLLLIATMGG